MESSSNSKTKPNMDVSQLMKEQLEIMKTEKELKELISKVNNQINQLLVEELQLKSSEITHEVTIPEVKPSVSDIKLALDSILINKQTLNLASTQIQQNDDEEDDDF